MSAMARNAGSDAARQPSPQPTAAPFAVTAASGEVQRNGFTREEELFRMKWGWAALDAARSEARREAGQAPQSN